MDTRTHTDRIDFIPMTIDAGGNYDFAYPLWYKVGAPDNHTEGFEHLLTIAVPPVQYIYIIGLLKFTKIFLVLLHCMFNYIRVAVPSYIWAENLNHIS